MDEIHKSLHTLLYETKVLSIQTDKEPSPSPCAMHIDKVGMQSTNLLTDNSAGGLKGCVGVAEGAS